MTYTRETTHILTADPKLVEAKLRRLRKQGWIIHSATPGVRRTIVVADVPVERPTRRPVDLPLAS